MVGKWMKEEKKSRYGNKKGPVFYVERNLHLGIWVLFWIRQRTSEIFWAKE